METLMVHNFVPSKFLFVQNGGVWMEIIAKRNEDTLVLQIKGNITTLTAPAFEEKLTECLTKEVSQLIFDFLGVEYMSSAGIRILMNADKVMRRQGSMKLIHVNEEIQELFEVTGLCDFLTIE
jgi:anti-anti-sigma factor